MGIPTRATEWLLSGRDGADGAFLAQLAPAGPRRCLAVEFPSDRHDWVTGENLCHELLTTASKAAFKD